MGAACRPCSRLVPSALFRQSALQFAGARWVARDPITRASTDPGRSKHRTGEPKWPGGGTLCGWLRWCDPHDLSFRCLVRPVSRGVGRGVAAPPRLGHRLLDDYLELRRDCDRVGASFRV